MAREIIESVEGVLAMRMEERKKTK